MPKLEITKDIAALLDSIYNPVLVVDTSGKVTLCNSSAENILNLTRDEVSNRKLQSIIKDSKLHEVVIKGKPESSQKIHVGQKTFLSNRSPLIIDGEISGAIAVLQDISELESISSELTNTKNIMNELTAIIESSLDGMYVTDGKGCTLRVNKAYERITGIKRDEVIGRSMTELIEKGFFNESVTLKVLKTRKSESIIQKVKTGKTVVATGNPILSEDGHISLIVTSIRDITELNRLQKDLDEMRKSYQESANELKELRAKVEDEKKYIFASKKMNELRDLAIRLSQVDSTVLIMGESGVGKEVFAELIHSNSARRNKPFIKISCAAIPEKLLESELFGYVKGAFTGARTEGKAGLFELADKGTLFLDEIGELDLGLQAKLLRAIQEQQIFRLGDTKPISVDVRILAATNQDMKRMVENNLFRKDLFFRLNVVPLIVPPLRDRKEAIIKFIFMFLEKFNLKHNYTKQITQEACDCLIAYDWPGNVRELENTIERIVVTSLNEVIDLKDLPGSIKNASRSLKTGKNRFLKDIIADIEKEIILEAVNSEGTTRKAAKILGIDQSTVVRKLKKLNVDIV